MTISKKIIAITLLTFCITNTSFAQSATKTKLKENTLTRTANNQKQIGKVATTTKAMTSTKVAKPGTITLASKKARKTRSLKPAVNVQKKSQVLEQKQLVNKKAAGLEKQSQPQLKDFQEAIVD